MKLAYITTTILLVLLIVTSKVLTGHSDPAWAGTTQYLAFEDPIELDAQTVYFVGVIAEYESEGALTVSVQPDSDTDNSTGEYNVTGDGDYVWFTSQTYTLEFVLS